MFFKGKNNIERFLIVGLGNPGLQYEETRHNAGFMVADRLSKDIGAEFNKHKFDSVYAEGKIGDIPVIIAKPQTYMNLSGKAVVAVSGFFKIPKERILIISDDISLPVGNIRLRRKGSAGGHNGLKDIIELMGSDEIMRIKVGVGEREHHSDDLAGHVLGKIPKEQAEDFSDALDRSVKAAKEIVLRGIDTAMNKYSK